MVKINIIRSQQTAGSACSTKRKSKSSGVSVEDEVMDYINKGRKLFNKGIVRPDIIAERLGVPEELWDAVIYGLSHGVRTQGFRERMLILKNTREEATIAAGMSFADTAIAAVKAEMLHFEIGYDAERTSKDDDDQIIVSIYIDDNGDRVAADVESALKGGISAHLPTAEYEVDTVTEDGETTLFIVAFNGTPEE